MSWQTILISNPCKLSIKNNNILLRRLDEEDVIVVISEVSAVVIENPQVVIAQYRHLIFFDRL
jgi:CRISPR/Cas system-associated endonuclease Cas1